ncbi:hypothetical protein V6N11_003832 [Hibiscus sabdariffa]|uniref:Uncharacterized protein n=1 Tax=Hibiscus sabdariffa TaxID=183260 RepID=A0ABR2SEG9_9ROSI
MNLSTKGEFPMPMSHHMRPPLSYLPSLELKIHEMKTKNQSDKTLDNPGTTYPASSSWETHSHAHPAASSSCLVQLRLAQAQV